jgi:tetratricopeptide (TPR) repeat protein
VLNRLLDWVKQGSLAPCFRLLEILSGLGGTSGDELVFLSVQADLLNHTWFAIDRALSKKTFKLVAGKDRAAALEYIYGSLKVLINGNEKDIRSWFKSPPPEKAVYAPYKAQILNNHACFFLGIGDSVRALEAVKEAIHLSQNRSWAGLARAYRIFALVNLSRRRTEINFRESGISGEALEYSDFAVENAEKSRDPDELAISAYYAASIQLLFGNVSKALRYATQAEESALAAGRNDWADRACFLRGKIRFETGHYREALTLFECIREKPHDRMTKEKEILLNTWAYRARIYSQNPLSPKPSKCGSDGDLFEVEAAWLSGDCKLAAETAACFSTRLPQGDEFLHIEQPDWHSGFAQCEFLLIPRTDLFARMCGAFRYLALAKISPGGGENCRSFQHFLRDDRFSEMDPNDPFYFYAWFRMLEESGAAQVDMNTAVSMAFKRLQRRATRIDDMDTRRDWLSLPRWNAALSQAAHEYKLI